MTRHAPLALLLITGCMSSASSTTAPTNPNDMPTAGSSGDTGTDNGIFGLHDSGTAWEDTDGGLMMLPQDAGADAQEPLDAGTTDAAIDAETPMLDAGPPPPPPGKTCDTCTTNADCAEDYRCDLRPKDGMKECFLRNTPSLYNPTDPTAYTSCSDLLPLNHLRQFCYVYVPPGGTCGDERACGPYDDALTCAEWKAYWGPQTTY